MSVLCPEAVSASPARRAQSVTLSAAFASVRAFFLRRPDVWIALFAAAVVGLLLGFTRISSLDAKSLVYTHLADSFGVGLLAAALAVFTELLLRAAPERPRRALRLAWLAAVVVGTAILVGAFAPFDRTPINWVLQGLVLVVGGLALLLAVLLPATGLVRPRDTGRAAFEVARHWCTIFAYLATGGYLLAAVRIYSPTVIDPILLRMDLSLGFNAMEHIVPWIVQHPWLNVSAAYGYPLLGFFLAGVAASLHLAGSTAGVRRLFTALLLVTLLGQAGYWCAPAIGPIHAFPQLVAGSGHLPGGEAELATMRAAALAGPDRVTLKPHLARDVMPSLHTTFTLVALAAAWSHRRRFFWWWLPLGFVQIATTLTLAVHYVVDLVAAVPLAVLCWALADAAVRRFPPSGTAPLPPLIVGGAQLQRRALALGCSIAAALGALVLWGKFAPLSPWLAWPLVLVIAGVPACISFWLFKAKRNATTEEFLQEATERTEIGLNLSVSSVASCKPDRDRFASNLFQLLACAVFCTGGAALVLEQVSEKYLATLVGASRPAATIVLAVYFAGLALGAWLCPKRSAGAPRRLALLELFIAAWSVLLATAFFACDRALGEWLAAHGTSAFSLGVMRAAVAVLWLLPPTLAMGAQLPTLAAVLAGHRELGGAALPRFYALNLAGACAFTLAAPPLLFDLVGANGALWFVAVLGLFVGVALWFGLPAATSSPSSLTSSRPLSVSPSLRLPTLLSFAAGFVFFALEVVWFHLISAVGGASTYSFSLLLGLVLLGLALGGRSVARTSTSSLSATLGWTVFALALGSALWPWAGRAMATVRAALDLKWFWGGEALKFAVVSLLVLPPAIGLGKIFPLLLRAAGGDTRLVSRLSTANVLGCVAGALVAGFALLPTLGAEHTLLAITLLVALAALIAGGRSFSRPLVLSGSSPLLPLAAALVLLIALPRWDRLELTRGYGVYLAPQLSPAAELVSFREDFRAGFVTVARTPAHPAPVQTLLQNGKFDADDAGEQPAQIAFGLIAALHAPALDRALVIGAGSGQTASVMARFGFHQLDIAELSPAHLAAAREHFAHLNHGVFDRPGVTVHVEDGRNFLLRTRHRYDVIQIELTSVWFAGATNLYSREFYALARARLAPGGALVQWIQLHHLSAREIATILATARAEFAHVAVWRAGQQACLVATPAPVQPNVSVWQKWRESSAFAAERALTQLDNPAALAAIELATAPAVDALLHRHAAALGLNTDRNRWLEFQSPKYYLSRHDHRTENLRWLTSP